MADVAFMLLANYAEDNNGLLYVQGGAWDTVTVHAPLENAPPEVFTAIRGFFVARIAFHQTETNRDHTFGLVGVDEDGTEVIRVEGEMRVGRQPGLPPGWPQHVNLVIPLTGAGLPRPGLYRLSLLLGGDHKDDLSFRVIKGF